MTKDSTTEKAPSDKNVGEFPYPTEHHLEQLAERRRQLLAKVARLEEAIANGENQLFAQLRRDQTADDLHPTVLMGHYLRARLRGVTQFANRWKASGLPGHARMTNMARQREHEIVARDVGYWTGQFPNTESEPYPRSSVVYLLYDADGMVCYVGSTQVLKERLRTHRHEGKVYTRWQAYECDSRKAAYELEDTMLRRYKPYLNKKACA